jgi:hypothetical protein
MTRPPTVVKFEVINFAALSPRRQSSLHLTLKSCGLLVTETDKPHPLLIGLISCYSTADSWTLRRTSLTPLNPLIAP